MFEHGTSQFAMPSGTEKALKYLGKEGTLPFILLKMILKNFRFSEND